MDYARLHGLCPQADAHPSDKKTLDALQSQSGIETLIRKFNEFGVDRLLRIQLMGSYLRATEDSFPGLYRAVRESCEIRGPAPNPADAARDIARFSVGLYVSLIGEQSVDAAFATAVSYRSWRALPGSGPIEPRSLTRQRPVTAPHVGCAPSATPAASAAAPASAPSPATSPTPAVPVASDEVRRAQEATAQLESKRRAGQ
jgi:hypothetical protein